MPFNAEPAEDAGASTTSRFRFQHCCAAAPLFAAIMQGQDCEVICEWHEDYLVLLDGSVRAVSVKHREQNKSTWTIAALIDDGKLGHLFDTFRRGNGDVHCRFETNRAHAVSDLWSGDSAKRDPLLADLAKRLQIDTAEANSFVSKFQIEAGLPGREFIAATHASMLAAPALDRLGLQLDEGTAIRIAGDLIAAASEERISSDSLGKILLAPPSERQSVVVAQKVVDRCVHSDQLVEALRQAATDVVPKLPLDDVDAEAPPETTLTKKLKKGGLGPSVQRSAGRKRARWYAHRARYRDIPHREEELDSIEEWVQDQANLAEIEARKNDDESYGGDMFGRLSRVLSDREAPPLGTRPEDSNPALLAGAAFELTDACMIWWSPEFSVDDENA